MAGLKRDPIKHVRDRAKSRYNKGTECEICGSQENLDFHHYYSMTEMLDKWLKKKYIHLARMKRYWPFAMNLSQNTNTRYSRLQLPYVITITILGFTAFTEKALI